MKRIFESGGIEFIAVLLGFSLSLYFDNLNEINLTIGLPFIRISPDHGPNEKMMGKNYGYYNRRELPNTPASTANSSSTYNYVNMVFSKDGSTNGTIGGIKGVDNLIEIIIAGKVGGTELWAPPVGLANSSFEDVINYLAGTPQADGNTFPFINLA